MSSLLRKNTRFAPKLTERKQSRATTPNTSKASTPAIQKTVQISETSEIIPNDDEPAQDPVAQPALKANIFDKKEASDNADEAVVDEDEDPKKKSTTVIINPTKFSGNSRRSSSTVSASFRRGSINDDNRRMRRLSSITTNLGTVSDLLRRPSVSGSSTTGANTSSSTIAPQRQAPTRISLSESTAEPYRINIPTGTPAKLPKPKPKTQAQRSAGKISLRKRVARQPSIESDSAPVAADSVATVLPVEEVETTSMPIETVSPTVIAAPIMKPSVKKSAIASDETVNTKPPRVSRRLPRGKFSMALTTHRPPVTHFREYDQKSSNAKTVAKKHKPNSTSFEGFKAYFDANGHIQLAAESEYDAKPRNNVLHTLNQIPSHLLTGKNKLFSDFTIDENSITMEDLCKPVFPLGQVSEHFELAGAASAKRRKAAIDRRRMRLDARNKGISVTKVEELNEEENQRKRQGNNPDTSQMKTPHDSLQLKLTQEKIIQLEEKSTIVDRHKGVSNENREKVTENAFENPVISSTYGKRAVTDKWTNAETATLYRALSSWGTDFNIIAQMFPHRNRRQIKLKFNLEERKRPFIVELALRRKLPVDFDQFCMHTKQEFRTLEEYNQELKELKEKHEAEVKDMLEAQAKQRKEDAETQRKREVEIRTGIKSMSRAERKAELRKNEVVIGEVVKKQED